MFNDDIDERPRCCWCGETIDGTPYRAPGGEECCSSQCVTNWFLGPYEESADAEYFRGLRAQREFTERLRAYDARKAVRQ